MGSIDLRIISQGEINYDFFLIWLIFLGALIFEDVINHVNSNLPCFHNFTLLPYLRVEIPILKTFQRVNNFVKLMGL